MAVDVTHLKRMRPIFRSEELVRRGAEEHVDGARPISVSTIVVVGDINGSNHDFAQHSVMVTSMEVRAATQLM